MSLEDILIEKNMEVINLFDFELSQGPVLTLKSKDVDVTIETLEDEFQNTCFRIEVSDNNTHIKTIAEGANLREKLKEALSEWKQKYECVLKASKKVDELLGALNNTKGGLRR